MARPFRGERERERSERGMQGRTRGDAAQFAGHARAASALKCQGDDCAGNRYSAGRHHDDQSVELGVHVGAELVYRIR